MDGPWTSNHLTAPYLYSDMVTEYRWNNRTLQLPVAYYTTDAATAPTSQPSQLITTAQGRSFPVQPNSGPQTPTNPLVPTVAAKMIPVANATGTKTVRFVFIRAGLPPLLPDPTPGDGETLKDQWIATKPVGLLSDGVTVVYAAAGLYEYYLDLPVGLEDGYPLGRNDVSNISGLSYVTPNFATGLRP